MNSREARLRAVESEAAEPAPEAVKRIAAESAARVGRLIGQIKRDLGAGVR